MGAGLARQRDPLQRQRRGTQRLGEVERQWATGENLADGIARGLGIGRDERQLDFVQRAVRIPQPGRAALGDDLQSVMPRALTQRAQRGEALFVEVHQQTGVVGQAVKLHSDS